MDMLRKWEIRGIGFFSTLKILFSMNLVFFLVLFLLMNFFGAEIQMAMINTTMWLSQTAGQLQENYPAIFQNPILSSLVFSLIYSLILSLVVAISGGIYTLFALMLGGIVLKVREKDPESPFL